MDGFELELLRRLPLVQATLHLMSYVLEPAALEQLFELHGGRGYERALSFSTLVYLLRDALLLHGGSGNASFDAAAEAGTLPVAKKNAYEKLGRLPTALSCALLREGTQRLLAVMPAEVDPRPQSLREMERIAFDGKKIKHAAKRLKLLRGLPGKMLGGKLLVALHVRQNLALAMEADPDGEANDVPLVPQLVAQVRELGLGAVLWIGDRQFSSLHLPALLSQGQDHFLLRATRALPFTPDPQRPPQQGTDAQGRRWVQQWGWIGAASNPRRRYVRQIVLCRPAEKDDVILITDLLDAQRYPALDLLGAYLLRWGIENMFQQVTEVFALQRLIGSTPQAMVFQSALCFVLYNQVQVIRSYVAQGSGRAPADVSAEKLFASITGEMQSWERLGESSCAAAYFQPALPAPQLQEHLGALLQGLWHPRWCKSRPQGKRPHRPKAKVARGHGGHSSVWRILQAAKQQQKRP